MRFYGGCHAEANLSGGPTKETAKTHLERFCGDGCVLSLVHDEEMVSARKRGHQGKQLKDEETTCPKRDFERRTESGRIRIRTSICEQKSAGTA